MSPVSRARRWTMLLDLHGSHRYLADQTGRVALMDRSGNTPETTDDGILWVDVSRPLTIDVAHGTVHIPLRVARDHDRVSSTGDHIRETLQIARVTGQQIVACTNDRVSQLCAAALDIEADRLRTQDSARREAAQTLY